MEGLITLLYKGGARNTLNNWQPITLLNVSYKFFAKALQMRLQPILMEFISLNQSTFLPMRFILDNIFLTQETITHAKQSIQSLLFLKLYFLKACDKVGLKFLFLALQKLGFPELFIEMVQLLFQQAIARILVNDKATIPFPIFQGIRHGCLLAPYLFLIIGEILNYNVRREAQLRRIKGIEIPSAPEDQLIAKFADDTSLTIATEPNYVHATCATLN